MSSFPMLLIAVDTIALQLARLPGVTVKSHGLGNHYADFTSPKYKRGRVYIDVTDQQWPPAEEGAGCLLVRPTVTLSVRDISAMASVREAFRNMIDTSLRHLGPKPDHAATFVLAIDETPNQFTDRVAAVLEPFTGLEGVCVGMKKDREMMYFKEAVSRERARQVERAGAPGADM